MHLQEKQILQHLKKHHRITPIEALNEYGCFRLAARIHNLRAVGNHIETTYVANGNKKYAEYVLITET